MSAWPTCPECGADLDPSGDVDWQAARSWSCPDCDYVTDPDDYDYAAADEAYDRAVDA